MLLFSAAKGRNKSNTTVPSGGSRLVYWLAVLHQHAPKAAGVQLLVSLFSLHKEKMSCLNQESACTQSLPQDVPGLGTSYTEDWHHLTNPLPLACPPSHSLPLVIFRLHGLKLVPSGHSHTHAVDRTTQAQELANRLSHSTSRNKFWFLMTKSCPSRGGTICSTTWNFAACKFDLETLNR